MSLSSLFNRFTTVKQIPVFSKLNWFELQKIATKAKLQEYKKGEVIFSQGDPPDFFYCLISGRLQAYFEKPSGERELVEYIHRGKHFGIISLLTGEGHSLTFEAVNDSVVLKIKQKDFKQIMEQIPQLGIELSHSLSRRFRRRTYRDKSIFESTVISIYAPVEGTGGSTYAINLALNLQRETGRRVIFVDINPEKKAHVVTDEQTDEASPKWKSEPVSLPTIVQDVDLLQNAIIKDEVNVDLLNVVINPKDESLLTEISLFVSLLAESYHYVIVDLPSEMNDAVLKTLTQSDLVQIITKEGKEELKLARQVITELKGQLGDNYNSEKIQVLLSGVTAQCYLSFEEINKAIDIDVYAKLPHIDKEHLKSAVVSDALTVITVDPKSDYGRLVTRFARRIGGVLVGLVLGGGAALGVAHIGVIRVLEKENIPVDIVVGSSMGALVGSFWVSGLDSYGLEKRAREFQKKFQMLKLMDLVFPIHGFVKGNAIRRWLAKTLGNKTFYSTEIPFKVVAYDLRRRQEIVLNSGSLVEAVRKSIAIPGVISPVFEGDQMIIDGGVLNPLPTNVMIQLGIKKIIAVNVLQSPEHVSRGRDMQIKEKQDKARISFLKRPFTFIGIRLRNFFAHGFTKIPDIIVSSLQASEYLLAEQSAQQADVVIHPDLTGLSWYELYRVDDLVQAGEDATYKCLPEIKTLVTESRE